MMQLNGKRVLVMGLGVHGGGLGVARWLIDQGARVTVTDMASAAQLAASIEQLAAHAQQHNAPVQYVLGEHREHDFTSHDMLVLNPAVRPDSPWPALARDAGVAVETEMTLFFRFCNAPIVGITGTKGKTTTTTLAAAMLRQQFPQTVAAGNLRVSALASLARIEPTTPVVLELSSFQLVGLGAAKLSPAYACITNLAPDHLNYHGSMDEYAAAKAQIFAHQASDGIVVLNLDQQHDPYVAGWLASIDKQRLRTVSLQPGSGADCRLTADGRIEFRGEQLFVRSDLRLPGQHNLANALAAAALARSFGVTPAAIRAAVRTFGGVEHRLETVRALGGVRYINDTAATNPTATRAALAALDAPLVLLAGGADKGLPFDELAPAIVRRVKAVVLLAGSATGRLQAALEQALQQTPRPAELGALPLIGPFDDFAAAIAAAAGLAQPGDVVILSPGCASFGMFRNEFHRGEEFRRLVAELPAQAAAATGGLPESSV